MLVLNEIAFVTTNEKKFEEINYILSTRGISARWIKEEKVEIQSEDTSKVASYAAKLLFKKLKLPLIVEDTALFVLSLNGFPGCYSSYVFKTIGIKGLLRLIEGKQRDALFVTSICYVDSSFKKIFRGKLKGRIAGEERGSGGFGFDPVFIPDGMNKTLGEMTLEEKSRMSHRSRAALLFADWYSRMNNIYQKQF
jgi:XTP/dITP diphosphohydrolase